MSSVPVTAVSDCAHRRLQHPRLNRDNIVDDSVAAGAVGVLAVTTYLQLRWVLAQQCYANCWLKALHKPEPNKLCALALAKSSFTAEPYVFNLPLYARRDFSRLRSSCHTLEIEVGRYAKPKVPRDLRACKLCKTDQVEDERHFLLGCSFFLKMPANPLGLTSQKT